MAQFWSYDAQHYSVESTRLELASLVSGANIPSQPSPRLECCCSRTECASQQHGHDAMGKALKDLQVAAQVGQVRCTAQRRSRQFGFSMSLTWCLQALLARHEAYVSNAEQERLHTTRLIGELEEAKRKLAAENSKAIDENRSLLCQLEELNESLLDSDAQIKTLTVTLQEAEAEVQHLAGIASRTVRLETQLEALELEHAELQQTVLVTKEQEKSANQHWKRAEKALAALQEDVERVGKDAEVEHERYIEVLGRLERRREVELELNNTRKEARRQDSTRHEGQPQAGISVVSQFVNDILQDNANLQTDLVELRERLLDSQEDTDRLREQLMTHESITPSHIDSLQSRSLARDMELVSTAGTRELHVHHHFHEPGHTKEGVSLRQPRKRDTPAGLLRSSTSSKERHAHIRLPIRAQTERSLAAAAILSRTSVSVPVASPVAARSRLSTHTVQSDSTGLSHLSSSPPSSHRHSDVFERTTSENTADISRPTSPDGTDISSPVRASAQRFKSSQLASSGPFAPKLCHSFSVTRGSGESSLNRTTGEYDRFDSNLPDHKMSTLRHLPPGTGARSLETGNEPRNSIGSPTNVNSSPCLKLRRTSSHDTLLSVSGMDIHTLKQRPSQLIVTGSGLFPKAALGAASPSAALASSKPVLGAMVTASRSSLASSSASTSAYNHVAIRGSEKIGAARANLAAVNSENKGQYGKRLGDWVWARLGTGNPRSNAGQSMLQESTARTDEKKAPKGQGSLSITPVPVVATEVDEDTLRECLLES